MIQINLLPEELRKREAPKIVLPEIPVTKTLLICGALLLTAQIIFTLLTFYYSWQGRTLKEKADASRSQNAQIQRYQSQTRQIQEELKSMRSLLIRKFYWASLLNAITDSTSKGVWFRGFSVEEGKSVRSANTTSPKTPKTSDSTSPTPSTRQSAVSEKPYILKLTGSVMAPGQETAVIGKEIKSLEENPVIRELFSGSSVTMSQRKIKDVDVYDFELILKFKKGKYEAA